MLTALPLYVRTARRLRPAQWLYLPLRRAQARFGSATVRPVPGLTGRPDGAVQVLLRPGPDGPDTLVERAERTLSREFTFLNRTETLSDIDWRRRYVSHLWSYNLHYFDYGRTLAWAHRLTGEPRYAAAFVDLALSWARGTDPGRGDGWEPYAVSVRVVNWVYALALLREVLTADQCRELERSLAMQSAWLERRLEHHIQGNHLQRNFAALAVVGCYFDGAAAARWRSVGFAGTWAAVREQVLADGGHYERSPMYHAIALADFLDVVALCEAVGQAVPADVRSRIERMVDAFAVLSRPDGGLHLFNDAAEGIAPSRAFLERTAASVLGHTVPSPRGAVALPQTGYSGWFDDEAGERMVIDCGEPGPAYQPGHAHCDMLHFELDLGGRRFAVDAGVHGYADDPFREYVRSTRAHNTVAIGDLEQHEVWGTYRMARRGRVLYARHDSAGGYRFEGGCAPYHDPRAAHHRVVARQPAGWRVTDRVAGAAGAPLSSFLHLHPAWALEPHAGGWRARCRELTVAIAPFGADAVNVHRGTSEPLQGWHCPEFGRALPAPTLELRVAANDGREFGYEIGPVTS